MMESVVEYDDTRDDDDEEERRRRMTGTHAVSTSGRHRGGMDDGSSWIRKRRMTKGRGGEGGNDDDDEDDAEDDEDDDDGVNGDGGSKSITRRGRESPTSPLPRTRLERGSHPPSKGILSPISSIGRRQTTTTTTTPLASSSTPSSSKSVRFETELPNGFPERKPTGRPTPGRRASDFTGFGLTLDDYPVDDASPCASLLAVFAVVAFVSWMSTVIHGLFNLFALA